MVRISRLFFLLSVAAGMSFISCRNVSQYDVASVSDTTVIVSETDSLKLYKPLFEGGIKILSEYDCRPTEGENHVFVAAGAYTKSYNWSKFDHGLIAGAHIDGKFHEGYVEPANSGAFYYIHSDKRWGFVYEGYEQMLRDISAADTLSVGFSQVMLVSDGEVCGIHPRSNPTKLRHRRAICSFNDELYIVDSKHKITIFDFAQCLKASGVTDALYMDMGGMKYSAYREYAGGEWIEIHPRNRKTKYCTNYVVFCN